MYPLASLRFVHGTLAASHISSKMYSVDGTYILYFLIEQYANTIDVLRNEKPVYLWWGGEGQLNYLMTGNEKVGEAELVV